MSSLPAGDLPLGGAERILLQHLCDEGHEDSSLPFGGTFTRMWPGVEMIHLYGFDDSAQTSPGQPAAALIRYAPGAAVPAHAHPGYEHIIVLEGSQQDDRALYPRGTCTIHPPGTQHRVWSDEGCLVLAIWTKPVEVLE